MYISYAAPFGRAYQRMVNALFRPFDLKKWFLVGFTAFLAGLLDSPGGNGGSSRSGGGDYPDFESIAHAPHYVWDWLSTHQGWMVLIAFGTIVVIGLVIIITWLSSRGKFMFLDNVIHDRALVAEPWDKYKHLADSLFLWRVMYGFIVFLAVVMFFTYFFIRAADIYENGVYEDFPWFFIIRYGLLAFALFLIISFISLLLDSFIVPIMYQNNLLATDAWRKFMPLFQAHFFRFVFYGLFVFLIGILVFILVVLLGFMTCCIGLLLVIIPYISSVVLLPVSYTLRAFSVEFLAQFGPDYIEPEEQQTFMV